jgi:hypothetical protein
VTVLLIPNHEQITRNFPCGFQDAAGPLLRSVGCDVLDLRDVFQNQPDHPGLFIPDKHFSPRGNQILLDTLQQHLREQHAYPGSAVHARNS